MRAYVISCVGCTMHSETNHALVGPRMNVGKTHDEVLVVSWWVAEMEERRWERVCSANAVLVCSERMNWVFSVMLMMTDATCCIQERALVFLSGK